jgi:hypothetical protein
MDLETARAQYTAGNLRDVVIEPADDGNGWMVCVHDSHDQEIKITDHSGIEKVFHSIERATAVAKDIGFESVRVEERF